jgi:hypothetical protein
MHKVILGNADSTLIDYDTKIKVIDYLYSKMDMSKYRYMMLQNTNKLKFLQENEHYVSPNYKGFNYFLIMLTINEKHYCVVIDRKKLSYHKNQLDMKTLQVMQIFMRTNESLFRGTIMHGKLINHNNEYIFIIQDCFYLQGNDMLSIKMDLKMVQLDNIIKNHFKKEKDKKYCNNFELKLNKLYEYKDLENLINDIMPNSTLSTNGLIFYPKLSGITIIHLDKKQDTIKTEIITNNNEVIEQKSYHIIHNFIDFLKNRTYSYENGDKKKVYWLSRTEITDVYDISEKETSEKQGIALVPNLKISHLCNNNINDKPVKFNCIFSNKFKKWIPLEVLD